MGVIRELNPGPLLPERRIIPLDQSPIKGYESVYMRYTYDVHIIYTV